MSLSWLRFVALSVALSVALTAPVEAGVPIHGRVFAENRPLPEATVRLFEHVPDFERGLAYAEGRVDAAPVTETTTDSRGRFRLDAPDVGMWTVRVEADGLLPAELVLRPLLDAVVLPDTELGEEAWLDVVVRGPEGEGIGGAWVLAAPDAPGKLRRRLPAEDRRWGTPEILVRTDHEGHARVLRPPETAIVLQTTAPGFSSATRQVRPAVSSPTVWMDLESGRPKVLRALDPEGRAVPNVLVFQETGPLPLGSTDAEGHVTVFQGESVLRLVLLDREARRGELRLLPPEPGKESPETPVVLQPSLAVSGRVIDRSSRLPLPGAIVWTATSFTRSAADGTFRLPFSARDRREVLAASPRYATERLPSAPNQETTLALRPAAVVGGRVVDENGRPRSDVEITVMERFKGRSILSLRNRSPERYRVSRTLPGGGFRIAGLAARTSWHLTFRTEGFAIEERTLDDLAPFEERSGLEIVLRRGCRGFGHVHDEDGEPLAGAAVRLTPDPASPASPERLPGTVSYTFEGLDPEPPEHLTDRKGRFELRDLSPGRFVLDATADGFVPGRLPAVEVPDECSDYDLGTLVLHRGGAIVGRAVDGDGRGVAGAEVRVTTDTFVPELYLPFYLAGEPVKARTEADGSFTVGALRPGEQYHLLVTKDGLAPGVALGVTAPHDEGLEVLLPAAARISGRVTDGAGRPVVGAALRLTPDVRGFAMSLGATDHWTDDRGAFEFSDVAPGRWTLWAFASSFQGYRRDGVEVEPATEIRDLEVVLAEGAELSGRVFAPDGSPAVGALVDLRPGSSVFTDGDGRYSFTGLTPGIVQVVAEHDDYPQVTQEVRIETGKTTRDLRFSGGVQVSGVVLGPGSEPVSEAQVVLIRDSYGATVPSTRSLGDGSFSLTGVPPGRYRARVSKEGYAVSWSRETTEVGEEDVTGLELRLSAGGVLRGQLRGLGREELARAEVVASNRMATVRAQLDGEGGYRIAPLAPGRWNVKATVESRGRHLVEEIVLEADRATATLDFDFGIGSILTGTVDVDGRPAAGLTVYLTATEGAFSNEVRTSSDGSFEIRDLASGLYRLIVTTERGFRYVEALAIDGDRHLDVEIFGARVAGRVLDALTGEPIAEASVRVRPLDGDALGGGHTRTDSTGSFRIEDVPEGPWNLVVRRNGYVVHERRIEVRGPSEGLEVKLTPGG